MTVTTDRILANIKVIAPGTIDLGVKYEVFNIVDEICRRYLQIPSPSDPSSPMDNWLTDAQWKLYARLIMDGTLARLFMMPDKPWTNVALAQVHQGLYVQGIYQAQGDAGNTVASSSPPIKLTDRLLGNLRVHLPGAQDSWIQLELFNAVDEFCRTALPWLDTLSIPLVEGQVTYHITPPQTEILQVISHAHPSVNLTQTTYSLGTMVLTDVPDAEDVAKGPLLVVVSLTPAYDPGSDVEHWIPSDMWGTWYELLFEGTLGKMMMQAAKPYSNPTGAIYHTKRFRALLGMARQIVAAQSQYDGQPWRYPFFAGRRSFNWAVPADGIPP